MLIRQAFNKGGGMSLWKGDVLSGVKSVIHDSMPALLTAEQRLAEGDEDELESLEEAKAALVDEAIEVIQARLKSHIEEMVVESTDKIFTFEHCKASSKCSTKTPKTVRCVVSQTSVPFLSARLKPSLDQRPCRSSKNTQEAPSSDFDEAKLMRNGSTKSLGSATSSPEV